MEESHNGSTEKLLKDKHKFHDDMMHSSRDILKHKFSMKFIKSNVKKDNKEAVRFINSKGKIGD
jgi:hypothetical protein